MRPQLTSGSWYRPQPDPILASSHDEYLATHLYKTKDLESQPKVFQLHMKVLVGFQRPLLYFYSSSYA